MLCHGYSKDTKITLCGWLCCKFFSGWGLDHVSRARGQNEQRGTDGCKHIPMLIWCIMHLYHTHAHTHDKAKIDRQKVKTAVNTIVDDNSRGVQCKKTQSMWGATGSNATQVCYNTKPCSKWKKCNESSVKRSRSWTDAAKNSHALLTVNVCGPGFAYSRGSVSRSEAFIGRSCTSGDGRNGGEGEHIHVSSIITQPTYEAAYLDGGYWDFFLFFPDSLFVASFLFLNLSRVWLRCIWERNGNFWLLIL